MTIFPKTTRKVYEKKVRESIPEFNKVLPKIAIFETGIELDVKPDHILITRKTGEKLKLTLSQI